MAKLIYAAITSLDGYAADESGAFDWAEPDPEVHVFVNELVRPIGTHLYGRRMYEVMSYWETASTGGAPEHIARYAAIWKAADKIVYSTTLEAATTERTRIERSFVPAAVREMKGTSDADLSIGGTHLAAEALGAGLVDEIHLFLHPVAVGGGIAALPHHRRVDLELLDERRFESGVVHLHFRVV